MSDLKPHLVRFLPDHDTVHIEIECPGVDVGGCQAIAECECWVEANDGRCDNCDADDHESCEGNRKGGCGYEELTGCGAKEWFTDSGEIIFADGAWTIDEYPLKTKANWNRQYEYWELAQWTEPTQ